ncbi:MAG: polysaccharide deacetylase family protein, partial [Thermodesulfobacteriota bacterium]
MTESGQGIPVVMYHTVGRKIPDWKWSFLTVPADVFEDHLRWLVRKGYRTVDLDELYQHVKGEHILPERSVVLTFDDGYLDNWTYVAPLLRKYSCKGTVFVNPDFVDPTETMRSTLDDVWAGKLKEKDLPVRGFMSWQELRTLADHGPLRVEAHAMTHTWYPSGPEIVDFHHPDDGYFWLDWNAFPEQKPFYLVEPEKTAVPFGVPVYEHQKSLAVTRYFPDLDEEEALVDFVRQQGGKA